MYDMTCQDLLGRNINLDDYVVFHNRIYQVRALLPSKIKERSQVRILQIDRSKTTKSVVKPASETCLLNHNDVLIYLLKRNSI